MFLKAVILIGGPQKGTRFRPLSFDIPKPLFPVAGVPTIEHLIEACCEVPDLREIFIIGFYLQADEAITHFVSKMIKKHHVNIRYLQEYTALGTAGGIYHFRDQIRSGNPDAFFLINGDVCGHFPLMKMAEYHQSHGKNILVTILGTEATRQQSQQYGCIVEGKDTREVMHYVEKPSTFVSTTINCGVYVCSLDIFQHISSIFKQKQQQEQLYSGFVQLEQEILTPLAGSGKLFVFNSPTWWSQIKTASSAIYANKHYLELYHSIYPERLAKNANGCPYIIGDVFIHPTARVHPSATLGPNVSVGKQAIIGAGVRIKESIVLGNATIQDHALVLHSIIGWNSTVGMWARVEGTPCDPNPNKAFAKLENVPLFNHDGRLNPSITVIGGDVQVPSEVIVLNCIVLPYKDLSQSYKNEIIL